MLTTRRSLLRFAGSSAALALLTACGARAPEEPEVTRAPLPEWEPGYGPIVDAGYNLPPIPERFTQGFNKRQLMVYPGDEPAGVVEVDIHAKFLYWTLEDGNAMRYPIGVGRLGRSIRSDTVIKRKEEWPGWTPTANMLRTEPEIYGPFREGVPGGLASPLGSRALYLYRGSRDTFFRIHGTNDLESIGNSGSAGCIRLFNQDMIDLYERVPLGTRVSMRSYEDSVRIEGESVANRGVELPPRQVDPEAIYGAVAAEADGEPNFSDQPA